MAAQKLRRRNSSPRRDVLVVSLIALSLTGVAFLVPYVSAGGPEPAANDTQGNLMPATSASS